MCNDCIFGFSYTNNSVLYKSNIESTVDYYYNIEYNFYKNGFSEIEPTYESVMFDTRLFRLYNYCPICGTELVF